MTTEGLQEKVDLLRRGRAPIPLTEGQARMHAVRLRQTYGLQYSTIAQIMGLYHGVWYTDHTWRKWCRALGAAPTKPGFTRKGETFEVMGS